MPRTETELDTELDAERVGWYELTALVRRIDLEERMLPGYFRDPDWSVRDLVAHVGSWLAEAQTQIERMIGGTYTGHDVDIDAINASLLEATRDVPWDAVWVQANAARSMLLGSLASLGMPDDEARWWVHKAASEHYGEHLPRLRTWVADLEPRRIVPPEDHPG